MSSPSETSSHDALPTIWGLLGRRPWKLLAATVITGVGVAALPCCGVGAGLIVIGSAALLEQLILAAGGEPHHTHFTKKMIVFVLALLLLQQIQNTGLHGDIQCRGGFVGNQ